MIGIVNYGLGNIHAIANIYKVRNVAVKIVSSAEELATCSRIILPGVGAFDYAMDRLSESGMLAVLIERVIDQKIPVLGICVGMQIMAQRSEEGQKAGLGWIEGAVRKFAISNPTCRVLLPHMGWNGARSCTSSPLFNGLDKDAEFYFLHSYYFAPAEPKAVLAVTDYNGEYASSVGLRNIFGVQFHPEKSHKWGIQLLMNFAEV